MRFLPDKFVKKTTITQKLREEISNYAFSLEKKDISYLEIGCDTCTTIISIEDSFTKILGIDNDAKRIEESKIQIEKAGIENQKINLILGTSNDIPQDSYDLILIDANHSYESVKIDYRNVIKSNLLDNFVVFFHDYGLLDAGVKKFIKETFFENEIKFCGMKDEWNPLGSKVDDWESVYIIHNSANLHRLREKFQ